MTPPAPHTTGSIAAHLAERLGAARGGVELVGPSDLEITHLSTLERAAKGAMTFIRSASYGAAWPSCQASAALVSRAVTPPGHDPARRALIYVPDADLALNLVLELLAPPAAKRPPGVHPSAVVAPTATLASAVCVGPNCTVEAGAAVGEGTVLVANVYLGVDVRVGRGCTLHPGVCILDRCTIGDGCILFPGVVIGADGFGYRPRADGQGVEKIPHIGHVEIGNGVEIGANACVDRAKFGATLIGDGTKIDNLVQLGHGCRIGRSVLLCGHVGLAGSVEIGDGAILAGQAGVADNLKIGARTMITAQTGVTKDIPADETWGSTVHAMPVADYNRDHVTLRRFARQLQELRARGIDPLAALLQQESGRQQPAPASGP